MSRKEELVTKKESLKSRIVRALLCAVGEHEAWERYNITGYKTTEVVRLAIPTRSHGDLYCAVCKHCRVVYVRKRTE